MNDDNVNHAKHTKPRIDASGLIRCADGKLRPPWASMEGPLQRYYDEEWGRVVDSEQGVFERLCLEGFQAGLSWSTILVKREAFREVFHGFDVDAVAGMGPGDVERLMQDKRILRNRRKLEAAISNARATKSLWAEGESLSALLWSFQPEEHRRPRSVEEIPSRSPESEAMAKELKRRGFTFVGPVTCYALMQAIGIVNDRIECEKSSDFARE